MTNRSLGRWSPSLFTRIFVLLMVCLVTAFAVNTIKTLIQPPPPRETHSVTKLAAEFRLVSFGEESNIFDSKISRLAPAQGEGRNEQVFANVMAELLGVPQEAVRFSSEKSRDEDFGPPAPPDEDRFRPRPNEDFKDGRGPSYGPPPRRKEDGPGRHGGPEGGPPSGPEWRDGAHSGIVADSPFEAGLLQDDGSWLILRSRPDPLLDTYTRQTLMWLLGSVLIMVPVAHYFARGFTEPIKAFVKAAEQLGRNPNGPPIAVTGPAELDSVAKSLNLMQDRLRTYVQERTEMVGAIAHDLRTPLTRLAFRIETAPEDIREKAAEDIAEMEAMIQAAMAFVRDATEPGRREVLELRSLLESVTDDMVAVGFDVTLEPGSKAVITGDPLGLKRLFTNLVANAVKFGTSAQLKMTVTGSKVIVEVDDNGPGLPESELERVFDPFYRTDRSRSRQTGGIGLGLAVVRTIASGHGGKVSLANLPDKGLRATVELLLDAK